MQITDMAGVTVGGVTGVNFVRSENNKAVWLWRCHCGLEFERAGTAVRSATRRFGKTSCGCDGRKAKSRNGRLNRTHGLSKTKLYGVHRQMKLRCYNPSCKDYPGYGGRGIRVCDGWMSIYSFIEWANASGYREGLTIERLDVNGDYQPDNCTWIENAKQAHNTRRLVKLTLNGETHHASEWSRRLGIKHRTIITRKRLGWSDERILTVKPVHGANQFSKAGGA